MTWLSNPEARATPPEFRDRIEDCDTCHGSCVVEGTFRYSGEPFGGFDEYPCDDCERTGEKPKSCEQCDRIEPLNDEGVCERCHDSNTLTLAEFDEKYPPFEPLAELRRNGTTGEWM